MLIRAVVLLAAALSFHLAHGADLKWPDKVRFALYEAGYLYADSTRNGIDKDVVEEVAKRAGFKLDFILMARARIWIELQDGTLMATGSGIQNTERDKFAYFLPYLGLKNYVIRLKTQPVKSAPEFAAQSDLSWGKIRGYVHGPDGNTFLAKLGDKRLQDAVSQENLYQMLKGGRFAAMFGLPPFYAKYLKDHGMENDVSVEDWFPNEAPIPHHLVLSRKFFGEAEVAAIKRIHDDMKSDGTLEKIFTKYVGKDAKKILPQ